MGMMNAVTKRLRLVPILTEAADEPNPENFVPVFDWNTKSIWVWVKKGNKVIGPAEVPLKQVSKYKGKLGFPSGKIEYVGMIDPSTFKTGSDIYPWSWKPGDSLEPGQPIGDPTKAVFKPPKMAAPGAPSKPGLPSNVKLTGSKDPNGLPEAEDEGSGEEFSVLPDGKFAQWDEDDEFYYAVEPDEDGDYVVQLNPKWTLDQVQAMGKPEPKKPVIVDDPETKKKVKALAQKVKAKIAAKKTAPAPEPGKHLPDMDPPEGFELPPNYSIEKVTPSHVVAAAPDGTKVKWIKVTNHWVHADEPHKDHEPLQAAPAPKKPKKTSIKATEKKVKAAEKKAKATGAAVVTATQVQTKKEISSKPEPEPQSTKYTGNVDANGLPLVEEIPDDDDDDAMLSSVLTLLPDDRLARWRPNYGDYLVYDYDPYYGYMFSKSGETISPDEAKNLMQALHLTVKDGKYHSYKTSGTEKAQQTTYETPLPPHCEKLSKKDKNGLPMVKSIPSDEFDDSITLSLLPDGRLANWREVHDKYLIHIWRDILGDYNYYPTHPAEYVTLKEVKKLQSQVPASPVSKPAPKPEPAPKPAPDPESKVPGLTDTGKTGDGGYPVYSSEYGTEYSLLPSGEVGMLSSSGSAYEIYVWDEDEGIYTWTDKEIPADASGKVIPLDTTGALTPTGEYDPKGYPIGDYKGNTYSMLPDGKVGIWSKANGAYILYTFDSLGLSYYNTSNTWTPPSHHKSLSNFTAQNKDLAQVEDSEGTSAVLMPNGKFAEYSYASGTWKVLKVDVASGKKFVQTGEEFDDSDIHFPSAYLSLKPMGEVDENGLPTFQQKTHPLPVLSLLPNGDFGRWMQSHGHYRKYEFDPEDGTWSTSDPPEKFTVSDINAMYLKAGTEKFKDEGKPLPKGSSIDDVFEPTGKTDEYGHEVFTTDYGFATSKSQEVIKLPNETFGWKMQVGDGHKYLHMKYGDDGTAVPVSDEDPWVTPEQVSDLLGEKGLKPASSEALSTLEPTGVVDVNGYPTVKVVAGESIYKTLTELPGKIFARWRPKKGKYVMYEYDPEDGDWFADKPPTWIDPATLRAPGDFVPVVGQMPTAEPEATAPPVKPTKTLDAKFIEPVSDMTAHLASKLPDPSGLVYLGSGSKFGLGGAGKKDVYEDPVTKKRYIFKPAYQKYSKKVEPFRAYVQEASSALAMAVRPGHIPVKAVKIKGVMGTLQPWVDLDPLEGHPPKSLTKSQQTDVAVDHMMDWLHSQHDTYAGNLVFGADGSVLSIDKEQGFRFFGKDELSTDYNPNPIEPYYNKFWRSFEKGEIDFDPLTMLPALQKIEALDSEQYMGALRAYADDRFGTKDSKAKIRFMKQVLLRKLHLRGDFEKFITDLYVKRTGEPGEFNFDEGWITEKEKAKTKYKTVHYSAEKLAKEVYGVKDHYEYQDPVTGEKQPEKNYQPLKIPKETSKKKLFEFLDEAGLKPIAVFEDEPDPRVKTGSVNHIVIVDKTAYNTATVTKKVLASDIASVTPATPKYWPTVLDLPDKEPNVSDLKKLDDVPQTREGHGVMQGGSAVEGQSGKAKKWKDEKGEFYLLHFKLREKDWKKIAASSKVKHDSYTMYEADFDPEFGGFIQKSSKIHTVHTGVSWKHKDTECFLGTGSSQYAYMGLVWIKVRNTPASGVLSAAKAAINAVAKGVGTEVFRDPTPEERETMKLMRLLWAKSPKKADALTASGDITLDGVKAALKASKVSKDDQAAVYEEEVFKGYHSHVLPGRWKKMKDVRFVFNGIGSLESAVSILKSGLMSINERNLAGITQFGGSYSADVESGSGDGTLCRVVGKDGVEGSSAYGGSYTFQNHPFHGQYQAIIHPEVLDRLNTYMYGSDTFGRCTPSTFSGRTTVETKVKQTSDHHRTSNEISFRKGLHRAKILRIATSSETARSALINAARDEGLNEVNGVPIEDFVVVVTKLGDAYNKYVKPLLGV